MRLSPFDLPELVAIIVHYLSFRDKITCLLVCRQWHEYFKYHVFGEQVLHKHDAKDPSRLEAIGRYIRSLRAYFAVGDADLDAVLTYCPNILTFDMEFSTNATDENVQQFMERMEAIQHLILRTPHAWNIHKRLASVTRLKNLKHLEVLAIGSAIRMFAEQERLVTLLQAMPSLTSLTFNIHLQGAHLKGQAPYPPPPPPPHQIPNVFLTNAASSSSTPGEHTTLPPPSPLPFWSRVKNRLKGSNKNLDDALQSIQEREPWRTFIPRHYNAKQQQQQLATPSVPASFDLYEQPLDLTTTIPNLTSLHLLQDGTLSFEALAKPLFPLLPNLRELLLDFGCRRDGSCKGLDVIIPSCPYLAILIVRGLDCRLNNPGWIVPDPNEDSLKVARSFFANLPSSLRELSLERVCIEEAHDEERDNLTLLPKESLKHLRKLVLDRVYSRQTTLHNILVACHSLRELRLADLVMVPGLPVESYSQLPPFVYREPAYYSWNEVRDRSDQFLGSILEPWPCAWTLESIDLEGYPIVEKEAMAAWLDRLLWMPKLTRLALSVHQVRLMLDVRRCGISSISDVSEMRLQHVWQLNLSMTRVVRPTQGIPPPFLSPSDGTLTKDELSMLLEMIPRVRSIRYVGKVYPIFEDAARWLQESRPRLKVLHVLQ